MVIKKNIEDIRFTMTKNTSMSKLASAIDEKKADAMLVPFLKRFNKKKDIFTSSSCCGRIMLLGADEDERKLPGLFMGKWHRTVKLKEIQDVLNKDLPYPEIWFKQESYIFHLVCKDLKVAEKVLKLKAKLGIRRGGIFTIDDGRYIIELIGSGNMSLPVKFGKEQLLNKKQLSLIIKKANYKLTKNYVNLKKILKEFQKEL
jgi:tRNA wybutosine-synthesizing protein 3